MTTPHDAWGRSTADPDHPNDLREVYWLDMDCTTGDGVLTGPDGDQLPLARTALAHLGRLLIEAHVHMCQHP